ncbi:hypothetical protein [Novibacillus thermophilus]|uniref:hypothetical protein n=1 Tax=Novibacillus thermophilus TaxID=1471761 RepID=UPI0011EA5426|nr:hypothetical protein [Novibacillus thermophilus]
MPRDHGDVIDTLHEPHIGLKKKPRTYRNQARKAYLSVAKQRKSRGKATRKAIRKQLSYVQRNLKTIEKQMVETPRLPCGAIVNIVV